MYSTLVLIVVSFVINDYTLQKRNKLLLFVLKDYYFSMIFSKNSNNLFPKKKYNTVNSKKIDNILHKTTIKFKFYLYFYKLFKKIYIFESVHYFVLFINYIKHNVFANRFYFNRKRQCWDYRRFYKFFVLYFFKKLIFFTKFKITKNVILKLNFKKIKFSNIFLKFSKIILFLTNFNKKIYNFKNIFSKINLKYFNLIKQFFLRKTKCFNKSRYSRNRQNFRTGFYWCLYVNVVALVGLNFLFYKFIINFTALWYLFIFFFFIFFFSKFFKYNYINFYNIYYELSFLVSFFLNFFNIKLNNNIFL